MEKEQIMKALFDSYYVEFWRFIEYQIKDEDAARDITTEAFKYIYDQFDALETTEVEALIELLAEISLKGCIAFLKEKEEMKKALAEITWLSEDRAANADEILIAKELHMLIEMEEDRLPRTQKKVFNLFFSEVPGKEAANLAGHSPSTYRSTKQKVLEKFRKALVKAGYCPISMLIGLGIYHLLLFIRP